MTAPRGLGRCGHALSGAGALAVGALLACAEGSTAAPVVVKSGVPLNPASLAVAAGDSVSLGLGFAWLGPDTRVRLRSADTSVARVNAAETGPVATVQVRGVGVGETTIEVTVTSTRERFGATVPVRVTAPRTTPAGS